MLFHVLVLMGTSLAPSDGSAATVPYNPKRQGSNVPVPDYQSDWQNEQSQVSQNNALLPNDSDPVPTGTPQTRTTQYGWAGDDPSDYNTSVLKVGNRDNPLTAHAAALSDAEVQKLSAQPGDVILAGGQRYYYADRAPESDARVDLYQPQGMDPSIPDYQDVQDLGGGAPTLRGAALAQQGEANVTGNAVSTPVASTSNASPQAQAAYMQFLSQLNRGISRG